MGGRGRRPGAVPPQGQLQGLLGEQRLDQGQVQARDAASVQHQDLVARAQPCGSSTGLQHGGVDLCRLPVNAGGGGAPSLNASPSGRTSLTKILLFFWPSMCPVTAKPCGK